MIFLLCFAFLASTAAEDPSPGQLDAQLAGIRRIYVDILTGDESALKIRDLLITSLQNSKLFILTEDEEKADAVLKGSADDQVFTDTFNSSDGLNAHSQAGGGTTGTSRNTSSRYAGLSIGENESRHTEERKHEALATVRLVTKDGDVIWSATAESLGAKFASASSDVANKIAKKLSADFRAAKAAPK